MPYGSLASYGASPSSGKSDDDKSVGGFFENLLKGAKDFAVGIPVGLYNLGYAGVNDAAHALSGGSVGDQFMLDDAAKGIADYYVNDSVLGDFGAALIGKRDWGDVWDGVYENPFSAGMDLWTVASLGAGGAAKVGLMAKGGGTAKVTSALGGPEGELLSYTKRLSKNPLSAAGQRALITRMESKAAANPEGRIATRINRKATGEALRKTMREKYALAGDAMENTRTLQDTHGELFNHAASIKLGGYGLDDLLDGLHKNISGENLAYATKRIERAKERADLYNDIDNRIGGKGVKETAGSVLQRRLDEAKRAAASVDADESALNRVRVIMDEMNLVDTDAPASDILQMRISDARKAVKDAKRYDFTDEEKSGIKARVDTLDANREKLYELLDSDELEAWYQQVRPISEMVEDLYVANDPRGWRALADDADDALGNVTRNVAQNRYREYEWLHPDKADIDIPASVKERAVYRPHTLVDNGRLKINRIGKRPVTPDSSRQSSGRLFSAAGDSPDPMRLFDAFIDQGMALTHNTRFADAVASARRMTRGELRDLLDNGEEWVELSREPKLAKFFHRYAKTVKKQADAVDANDPALATLSGELDDLASLLNQGGRYAGDEVIAMPKAVFNSLGQEAKHFGNAYDKITKAYAKGTDYWRAGVLSFRAPQWILNNAFGQALLLGISHGPKAASAMLKLHKGAEGKALRRTIDALYPEISSTGTATAFARSTPTPETLANMSKAGRAGEKLLRASDTIGGVNAKIADDPFRRAAFLSNAKPHIDKLIKRGDAIDESSALRIIAKDTDLVDNLIESTFDDMIDFRNMGAAERRALRSVFPFYSWMKGMTMRQGRMMRDQPVAMEVLDALGQEGLRANEEALGELPSFVKGAFRLPGFLQNDEGTRVMTSAAMNPFTTPADLASAAAQFVPGLTGEEYGGESIAAQMNPFLKAPIMALTGTDPFYGGRMAGMKFLGLPFAPEMNSRGAYLAHGLLNMPQAGLIAKTADQISGEQHPMSMYDTQWWQPWMQYFGGLPTKDLRLARARAQAQREAEGGMVGKW